VGVVEALADAVITLAFRLWSGDSSQAANGSADLTEMVGSQVNGALEQRKVRARFDGMAGIVADRLVAALAAWSAEFRDLALSDREAALYAVRETLVRTPLTDPAFFEAELDPLTLQRLVRRNTSQITSEWSLSESGTAYYDLVLAQCCAFAVEVADTLPRFEAGAFTELLRRNAQIITRLEEVLARLPEPADKAREDAERLEIEYRRSVARKLDHLEIFGLDFARPRIPLSPAYVDLPLSGERRAGGSAGSLGQWLASAPRLLIEGSAGSGKTTILQWIAVRAAVRDFTGPAASLNGRIPFFLPLRVYADKQLPEPGEFLDGITPMLATQAGSWPHEQLRSGRAFVLVDGVSDVPARQRREVVTWLCGLAGRFPEARYVVTTRPGALRPGELDDAGFTRAVVEPMDPVRIRTFVDQWYASTQWWQRDARTVDELAIYCDALLKTLDSNRFVREFARTPLLAGLVCALNEHVRGRLPRRRGDLLEAALGMFYKRDRERGIPDLGFGQAAARRLLGDLARWMLRNGSTAAPADSARELFGRSASVLREEPGGTADLYHSLLRGGLLRETAAGQVTFRDRMFREYLAASALVDDDSIGEIVKNASDDEWRDVVIFAAGRGTSRQATEILRGLLRPQPPGTLYQRRLMAVRCLGEVGGADPRVLADIEGVIPELLPPRSLDQAEALSDAGDEMIPYLARTIRLANVDQLPPVIRAASLIGGADAFDLIAAVAQMSRISIGTSRPFDDETAAIRALRDEFIRAAEYFDRDTYKEKVLGPLGIRLAPASPEGRRVLPPQRLSPDKAENMRGHAFLSYVREDTAKVAQLAALLRAARIPVWRDTADIWPGDDWRARIRRAINDDALVFVACFSTNSQARAKTYQNEELALAIDQLRLRSPDTPWLIPVRLDECEIPDRDIGYGRTLRALHHADLFGDRYDEGASRLIAAIERILGTP
jgi:hypothetical protein